MESNDSYKNSILFAINIDFNQYILSEKEKSLNEWFFARHEVPGGGFPHFQPRFIKSSLTSLSIITFLTLKMFKCVANWAHENLGNIDKFATNMIEKVPLEI